MQDRLSALILVGDCWHNIFGNNLFICAPYGQARLGEDDSLLERSPHVPIDLLCHLYMSLIGSGAAPEGVTVAQTVEGPSLVGRFPLRASEIA